MNKELASHFLRKELKALAELRGDVVIDELKHFDDKKAKQVRIRDKKTK